MITQIDVVGINYDVDENVEKYVHKRIGRLDRFLPRHSRKTASVKVNIKQVNKSHGNKYEVDAIISVPNKTITARDESSNVLAAIDIIEAKLNPQIAKYKMEVLPHVGKRGIWAKLKRRPVED